MESKVHKAGAGESTRTEAQSSRAGSRSSDGDGAEAVKLTSKQPAIKVHTSFRINPMVEIFGDLKGKKRQLMRKIKFDGMMCLPKLEYGAQNKVDRQFTFWLMRQMDPHTGALHLCDRGRLDIRDKDISLVLGLPDEGEDIILSNPDKIEITKGMIKEILFLDDREELDLENIRKVLQREIRSDDDSRAFVVAAVIFSVSYFLAPKGRSPKIQTEVLETLVDVPSIFSINWSAYVLKTLRDSCYKVNMDVRAGASSVCLHGCLLLLQITYLDNLEFDPVRMNQHNRPRVMDFGYGLIDKMIEEDKHKYPVSGFPYGRKEMRHPGESLYTRGTVFWKMVNEMEKGTPNCESFCSEQALLEFIAYYKDQEKRAIRKTAMEMSERMCDTVDRFHRDIVNTLKKWIKRNQTPDDSSAVDGYMARGEDCYDSNKAVESISKGKGKAENTDDCIDEHMTNVKFSQGYKEVAGMRVIDSSNMGKHVGDGKTILLAHGIRVNYNSGGLTAIGKRIRYKTAAKRPKKGDIDIGGHQKSTGTQDSEGTAMTPPAFNIL